MLFREIVAFVPVTTFIVYHDHHQRFFIYIRLISFIKLNILKKIIHPTDFSENALKALEFAIDISKKFNAELILLHVADFPGAVRSTHYSTTFPTFSEYEEADKKIILEQLKEYAAHYQDKTDAESKILFDVKFNSSTTDGIFEAINERNADLVVVGTKGKSILKELIVGSTTKSLVAKAVCPVLAIPENAFFRKIQQIVYASDFDPNDIPAIKRTIPISQAYHAKLSVLHLFENEAKEQIEAVIFQQQLTDEVKYLHLKYDTEASNNIARSIVNYLQLNQADLLVMFEKESTGITRLFQKSTVNQFVDHALTIPFMSYNIHSVKSPNEA